MAYSLNSPALLSLVLLALAVSYCSAIQLMGYKLIDYRAKSNSPAYVVDFCTESHLQHKLVVRETTLEWLNDSLLKNTFYSSLKMSEQQLSKCREGITEILPELSQLANTNTNICGAAKIEAIENFHRKYMVNSDGHIKLKKPHSSNGRVRLLKEFFMLYATKISSICEKDAVEKLNIIRQNGGSTPDIDFETDIAMQQLTETLKMIELRGGYDDMFLLWKFVSNLPIEKNKKLSKYISAQSTVKLNIQMQNTDNFYNLKGYCQKLLKPVYDNTFMPVMRLVQLGYYPESDLLIRNLQTDKSLNRLFRASLLCDLLAPVDAYQNEQLESSQIVVLERQEAEQLPLVESRSKSGADINRRPPSFLLSESSTVSSLLCRDPSICKRKLKSIWRDMKARDKTYGDLLKRLIGEMKSKVGHRSNFLLSSKTSEGTRTQEDMMQIIKETLKDVNLEGSVAPNGGELVRKKRGILLGVISLMDTMAHLMVSIIWVILKTVTRVLIRSVKIMSKIIAWTMRFLVKVFI